MHRSGSLVSVISALVFVALPLVALPQCSSPQVATLVDGSPEAAPVADRGRPDRAQPAPDVAAVPDGTAVPDVVAADVARAGDMNLHFPEVLEGVWLVGWSGGLNHYSWVRFGHASMPSPVSKADAWILDGKDLLSNAPIWNCSGKTTWYMGAAADTAYLDFPSPSCLQTAAGPATMMGYVFSDYAPPTATDPRGAVLLATVKDQPTLRAWQGFKFPDDWCDANMTTCKNPF